MAASASVPVAAEVLEVRQLLSAASATLVGGVLQVLATNGNDNIVVEIKPTSPTLVQVSINGAPTQKFNTADVNRLTR